MSTDSVVPNEYRCEHLFLLVGTNPLPNFVAAKLLVQEGGKVYLVHSSEDSGTASIARRLSGLLGRPTHNIRMAQTIEVKEADATDIYDRISATARGLSGTIGLHYTGGTKAMAIHAYRAMKSLERPVVFSYLDSRTLTLRIEPLRSERSLIIPVQLAVKPTVRELTELHGEPLSGLPTRPVMMDATAIALAEACSTTEQAKAWRAWCNDELRSQTHPAKDWLPEGKLRAKRLKWPSEARFESILRTAFEMWDQPEFDLQQAQSHSPFKTCKGLCEWLDGKWLEHYVLDSTAKMATEANLHDFRMAVETDRLAAQHGFELDIAIMRGYQLFAISCTTDTDRGRGKSKLFEAYVRARQLGGDEARVGLVALCDKPAAIEHEVEQQWQAEGKVRVFGPEHLPNLADLLKQWFTTAG